MDLAAIETFCRAVEVGNLTRAADALHVTKSVVSRRLSALEEDLGTRLLTRTTRGVQPTEAGQAFYERCTKILEDLEDARQTLAGEQGRLVGRLRFAAPRAFTDYCLQYPLVRFMQDHPDLVLEANLSDQRVDVIGGGYDIALRISSALADTSLIAKRITDIPFATVASPDYLKQHGTPAIATDLEHHRGIFYSNTPAQAQWRFIVEGRPIYVKVNARMLTNSGNMQASSAIAGLGVAVLPRFFVAEALRDGRLVEILLESPHQAASLFALYPEKKHLPAKSRALIDFLTDWFKKPENRAIL